NYSTYSSYFLLFSYVADHLILHSFPTRRSSDLKTVTIFPRPGTPKRRTSASASILSAKKASLRRARSACFSDRKFGFVACAPYRSEEHTSELQSRENLVCRLLLEKKKQNFH